MRRKFTVADRKDFYEKRDYAFADWDLDIPRLSGTFATTWHDARCSVPKPPTVLSVFGGGDYWHGNTADMPGGGEMLSATVSRPIPTTGGPYQWLTAGETHFSCLPSILNGSGEGFLAITSDGKKYWFNHLAQYAEPWLTKPYGSSTISTPRRKNVLYPSRIEDRFGNWVSYSYSNAYNQPVRLNQITSSDGRTLTLQYNASGYISQVNGDSLAQVTLPDNSRWTLNLNALAHAEIDINHGDDDARRCTSRPDITSGAITGSITSPSGAVGDFTVAPGLVGRSNVPLICTNWATPGSAQDKPSRQYPALPFQVTSLVLTSKTLSGPGLVPKTWTYDLFAPSSYQYPAGQSTPTCTTTSCLDPVCLTDSCAGIRRHTVTEPDGIKRVYRFGSSYQYNEGKLLTETTSDAAGTVLKAVKHTYNFARSGQPFAAKIGTSPQHRGDGFTSEYPRPKIKTVTTQQGTDFNWAVDTGCTIAGVVCMDTLQRATRVNLSSTLPGSPARLEDIAYFDQPQLWVMGQIASRRMGSFVMEETGYDAATALPLVDSKFGVVQRRRSFDTSSSVSSGQLGTLRTLADGKGNTSILSDWYRGVPRLVQRADTSLERAVVSPEGWITQYTNPAGYATGYSYDSLGRMSGISPPAGFASSTLKFEPVPTTEYNLAATHWRHTLTKGAARTITYYDGLWRPVMSRSFDVNNEAATRKVVVKAFDHRGQTTFESYPQRDIATVTDTSPGRRTQYDALSRPVRIAADSELGTLPTVIDYLAGFQTRTTNPRGKATTQSFWALEDPSTAQLAGIAAPEGVSVSISRDAFGKPTAITRSGTTPGTSLAAEVTRSYVYDAQQRLCKTIEPELGATLQAYDAANNIAWKTGGTSLTSKSCDRESVSAAQKIDFGYNALNQLTSTSYGDGSATVSRSYTADGLPETIKSADTTWTYGYNSLRLPTSETLSYLGNSAGYTAQWGYDANGHLSGLTYPDGTVVAYSPNALGEANQVGSYAASLSYHPNGAVAGYTYGNGVVHSLSQNTRGLPWVISDAKAGSPGVLQDQYSYDENANPTRIADLLRLTPPKPVGTGLDPAVLNAILMLLLDDDPAPAPARKATALKSPEGLGKSKLMASQAQPAAPGSVANKSNAVAAELRPGPPLDIAHGPNGAGPASQLDPEALAGSQEVARMMSSMLAKMSSGNSEAGSSQPAGPDNLRAKALSASHTGPDGRSMGMGITAASAPAVANARSMAYDELDRLVEVQAPELWAKATYGYDVLDNIRSSTVGNRTATHNYDASTNRLQSIVGTGIANQAYSHDANGNITQRGGQSFTFDLGNRISSAPGKASYVYDGLGRRTKIVSTDGSTRIQMYDAAGQLIWATSSGGPKPGSNTKYIYLAGKLIAEVDSAAGTQYAHTDALGSPVARTDAAGAVSSRTWFEPYGATFTGKAPTAPNSIGFTGHVNDPDTGLVYMQQRYY
ncbi:MAG: hypothetical protein IV107_22000, partial [Paucibacter sp.]|nr:hypothetical protein [Roseateles sp.]